MALKGLDIFKLSPKKNCKDCGCPTCMAFCMKVAQGALPIEKCPHFSPEAIASLSEATAPPMKTINVGDFKLGGESAVDINLAKQLNVLLSQLGVPTSKIVMNLGTAAAGYGFEYLASTIDRVKDAALKQNDDKLQMPVITPCGDDAWGVKEAILEEADMPEWGAREERGIQMEIITASACIASGSDAVILRHPESVKTISEYVSALM